jgi:hypothetical protein
VRKLAFLATFAVFASLPGAAASPARTDPSVLAIDWRVPGRERLLLADPLTLRPRGVSSLDLSGHTWPYAFTSDRSRLVLGRWQPPSLRVVDARKLRLLRDVPIGGNRRVEIKALAWLDGQIVVLLERPPRALALLRVDPAEGRVVASTTIGRWGADVAATRTRFIVLLTPIGRIGPTRLLVVTRDRVRTVRLPGVRAGSVRARQGTPHTVIQPGLAVSPREPRAWVIAAKRSADVDLRTLAVRYRGAERHPSSSQKEPVVGSARDAQWLSPGRLVVAGWDAAGDGRGKIVFEQSGLRLLETTGWTDHTIHSRALLFYIRPRQLLTIADGAPDCVGPMMTAYTLAGAEVYRVCESGATGELEFVGRYARLGRIDGRVAVVDLDTGAVVARVHDVRVNPLEMTLVQEP